MNKKLLICGAIATALVVSACVKKEAPKEDEQEKVEITQPSSSEPAQFESLPSTEPTQAQQQVEIPAHVEVERTQSENTTTEIRTTTHEAHATTQNTQTTETAKPVKAESVKAETTQTQAATSTAPKTKSGAAQSEDDAVAAAIAAATPALKN